MLTSDQFQLLVANLRAAGWANGDIEWAENIQPPQDPEAFALETIFVICNSGMRFTVAQKIFDRVKWALQAGNSAADVFGHKAKAAAMDTIWQTRAQLYRDFMASKDRMAFLRAIPWIGPTTVFHLGKNFGEQVAKPDVHLVRLGKLWSKEPQALCEELANMTGLRVATIDTLLWRACATGVLCTRTGNIGAAS
ncbi:hypothetical protein [Bosea sp. ANAM02]|uniref:hypothetical protein n=1 Tax=Bosea sp. ANAM02 TaxID=2020412 RepID=UPI00140F2BDD|nr:hypothetical protein [Bosea sp. ANAM02]BCB22015.1 hypothetical protein OCUBac02_49090 [Bosea sp. ANAM02]